jgi:tRNA(Arg) A34 adenosine deaminase TadA
MDNKIYMAEAIKLSIESVTEHNGGPFGCVIVKNGEIIARGNNRVTANNDPTAHAEIVAIREACQKLNSFQLSDCEIYTSCEPCPMCLGAIYWARPKKVYYANTHSDAADIDFDDKFIYQEINLDVTKRKLPFEQLMRTEALEAFKLWKAKQDKTVY